MFLFFSPHLSKVIRGLLGRGGNSQWVSQHFTRYMFNQIYTRRRQCVTGRLTVVQCGGDRSRNVKRSGNKVGWRSIPRDVWRLVICRGNISSTGWGLQISLYSHIALHHVSSIRNRRGETWGGRLRGTVQSEKCPCRAIFPELPNELPSEGKRCPVCIDSRTNMTPFTDNLSWTRNTINSLYCISAVILFLTDGMCLSKCEEGKQVAYFIIR